MVAECAVHDGEQEDEAADERDAVEEVDGLEERLDLLIHHRVVHEGVILQLADAAFEILEVGVVAHVFLRLSRLRFREWGIGWRRFR